MAALMGHGHGGKRAANIDNWTFHNRSAYGGPARPTPYLVGPVVGTVKGKTARVLVELAANNTVTMVAYIEGEVVCTKTKEMQKRTPSVIELDHLIPGKEVRVTVNVGESGQEREAYFTTPYGQQADWKIATVSCNCHSLMENLGMWPKLAKVIGDVDAVLHMGDQVYADMARVTKTDKKVNSAWVQSNRFLEELPREEWEGETNKILEQYRRVYRDTWNYPPVAQVLASAANYMICDDHEVVDDLGDSKEHTDENSREFFVIKLAYQVYLEYQKQLLCDIDVHDMSNKAYYAQKLSPKVGLFMLDNRIERSLHRSQGSAEQWEHKTMLGPTQWAELPDIFDNQLGDCETVLFVSPTPLIFLSQSATVLASKVNDDAMGLWGHKQFKEEQAALCTLLSNWQDAKPNRSMVTLGGDVHVGGFTDSSHESHEAPLHQMTASAIGNMPEVHMDRTKEFVMTKAMALDTKNFKFKAKHHKWYYGPNFGLLDFTVGKEEQRPDITMTLVTKDGEPLVRNLTFGDSGVDVNSADLHGAAVQAHATVQKMK